MPARDLTAWEAREGDHAEDVTYSRLRQQPGETPTDELQTSSESSPSYDATDSAVELAAELGVDLSTVTGSGADGRITKADVEASA